MLPLTKDQIFTRVAASVNGEATAPSVSDTEYGTWGQFLEEANQEWPLTYDFRVNHSHYRTTAPVSGTSVGLPSDFVKLQGYPTFDGSKYQEVFSEDEYLYETFVSVRGNPATGYYFHTSPLRSAAGATTVQVAVPYISFPTSMATGTAVSPIPDANFLVKRTTAKVLKQRGDSAFTLYDDEADTIMARMIEQEVVQFRQLDRDTKTSFSRSGFTIGQD